MNPIGQNNRSAASGADKGTPPRAQMDAFLQRSANDFTDVLALALGSASPLSPTSSTGGAAPASTLASGFRTVKTDAEHGIAMQTCPVSCSPVHMMRANSIMPCSPQEFVRYLDSHVRLQWDENYQCGTTLEDLGDGGTLLKHFAFHSPVPSLFRARDFEVVVGERHVPLTAIATSTTTTVSPATTTAAPGVRGGGAVPAVALVKAFSVPKGYLVPVDFKAGATAAGAATTATEGEGGAAGGGGGASGGGGGLWAGLTRKAAQIAGGPPPPPPPPLRRRPASQDPEVIAACTARSSKLRAALQQQQQQQQPTSLPAPSHAAATTSSTADDSGTFAFPGLIGVEDVDTAPSEATVRGAILLSGFVAVPVVFDPHSGTITDDLDAAIAALLLLQQQQQQAQQQQQQQQKKPTSPPVDTAVPTSSAASSSSSAMPCTVLGDVLIRRIEAALKTNPNQQRRSKLHSPTSSTAYPPAVVKLLVEGLRRRDRLLQSRPTQRKEGGGESPTNTAPAATVVIGCRVVYVALVLPNGRVPPILINIVVRKQLSALVKLQEYVAANPLLLSNAHGGLSKL